MTVLTNIPNYPGGHYYNGYGILKKNIEDFRGVRIIRVPLIPRGRGGSIRLALSYLSSAFNASLIAPLIAGRKVDLVFVFQPSPVTTGIPALLLRKVSKAPVFLWVQDLWPETLIATGMVKSPWILKIVGRLSKFIYSGCDRILIQSKGYAPYLEKMGVAPDKISFFPNSAETLYKPLKITPGSPEAAMMPDGFRLMFAGNTGKVQDFETILFAAEKLINYRQLHWIIVGDGSLRKWVQGEIRRRALGETVHMLGRYPLETMPRFFSLADVLLVTLKDDEIFSLTIPSKIQSYLACGKPILAALNGEGAKVVRESRAGIVVPAGNGALLAEAALKMYKTKNSALVEMGLNGRKYFEKNFKSNMLLDRLDGWIREELRS